MATTKVKKAIKNATVNWKTSLLGIAMGAAQIASVAMTSGAAGRSWTGPQYIQAGLGVIYAAFGLNAKDGNVTGVAE